MKNFEDFLSQTEDQPKFTGKQLVMLAPGSSRKSISGSLKSASIKLASFNDYKDGKQDFNEAFDQGDGILFEGLGIMVLNDHHDDQISMLTESSSSKSQFIHSEPERFVYALIDSFDEFLKGYKCAVDSIYGELSGSTRLAANAAARTYIDDATASWGIHATGTRTSRYTGKGVNVAILDTGFSQNHPDFNGRSIQTKSFIVNEAVNDLNGHGTHCVGIATGDVQVGSNVRYGVAKDANIFVGKVLSNRGRGADGGILAGMEWAIMNKCSVISMSLGGSVGRGESYSEIYNDLAKKAMEKGTIIIAAAGNDSERHRGIVRPVNHPANCPAILAVGALDNKLRVADFSCGGFNLGQIDIAGPGVDVFSSWIAPGHISIDGTSMATPFVAGVAAMFKEANPTATASDIWMSLIQNAKRLNLNSSDVGAGLVQAPR